MSNRRFTVATIDNNSKSHYIAIEIRHQDGKYIIECRAWERTSNGMAQTNLFGGYAASVTMVAPRFNAKKLETLAKTAMTLPHVQHDYERLIAKPEYANLGFPPFAQAKAAA